MTKDEAIAQMKAGKKITHRFFSDKEWMTMGNGKIKLEDGVLCSPRAFWEDRFEDYWNDGYEFFTEPVHVKFRSQPH